MSQVINRDGFAMDMWAETPAPPLDAYSGGPAVFLTADADIEQLVPHFPVLSLIVISFQSSADGRGFSIAAQLRATGFNGHIRAHGHILVDQFRAALRSGFSDIEISADQAARNPEHQWREVPFQDGYRRRLLCA